MYGQTDRQTDMAILKCVHLKLIIHKALRIIAALANHPAVPEVTSLSQLTLPLVKQSTAYDKEAELDHSSHSYCTPCPHHSIRISTQKEQLKIFQNEKPFCCIKCVSPEANIIFP